MRYCNSGLLDLVQRQTFNFFWEGAHPGSGLARDRIGDRSDPENNSVAIGGSSFGVMAKIVATKRGWITRTQASARLSLMLDLLERATCFHGHSQHFMSGRTGAAIPLNRRDDGGDLVETSSLLQGLLCARQYFERNAAIERSFVRNSGIHKVYGLSCWGLTASDDPKRYRLHRLHAPGCDNGVIAPSAALSNFPYAPEASSRALRYFYVVPGARLWGRYGFLDAFNANDNWYAKSFLAVD